MDLIIGLIGLFLSFFFAGSETAFISVNKVKIELWVRNKRKLAPMAQKFYVNPENFISTTLVGNNVANVLASSYATVFLIQYLNEYYSWLLITFVILLVGEIIPKVMFRTFANELILYIVILMRMLHFLLKPVVKFVDYFSEKILKLIGVHKSNVDIFFSKEDIHILLNEGKLSGVVEEHEHKIISRILELKDIAVREAMTPRISISALPGDTTVSQARKFITKTGFTKVPVYEHSVDNITGVVFMYDLFNNEGNLKDIIQPVIYIPLTKKCDTLLKEFKDNNISIAVVLDEFGGTAGIVTIEDLVEELFGQFEDNLGTEIKLPRRLNQNTWSVDARSACEVLNEQLNIRIPKGNYETLAGYILNKTGYIPKTGDSIEMEKYKMVVSRATRNKIIEVRIIIN